MKRTIFLLCALVLFLFGFANATPVGITNGGFETDGFSGWETVGDASIQTSSFGITPTQGEYQALITNSGTVAGSNPNNIVDHDTLESFLDVSLNPDWHEGSAIKQTFEADAGDVLFFNWNFLTNETGNWVEELGGYDQLPYMDTAFIVLNNQFITLINAREGYTQSEPSPYFSNSLSPFTLESGFNSFAYQFNTSGTYTLAFGIVDVDDDIVDSGLIIDNLHCVPEPTTLLLIGIGMMVFLGYKARRFEI